jgi:hypothetical protein
MLVGSYRTGGADIGGSGLGFHFHQNIYIAFRPGFISNDGTEEPNMVRSML